MHVCLCNYLCHSILTLHFAGTVENFIDASVSYHGPSNAVIDCTFLNNQSFYCVVCCSTDPSVPPDSSVYNISTTRGTEVTVSLQGLTSGHMYYCTAAGTDANSSSCGGPVVGGVESYFNISAGNVVLWAHSSGFVSVLVTHFTLVPLIPVCLTPLCLWVLARPCSLTSIMPKVDPEGLSV